MLIGGADRLHSADVTKDVTAVNSTAPTSPVGRNVRGAEFTGRTHQQRVALVAAERVGAAGGPGPHSRPPRSGPETDHQRNVVERGINNHGQFRAVATCYDCEYLLAATIDVASIRI